MSVWRSSVLDTRPKGLLASPYYEWARATRFAYYGAAYWLPVLIELRDTPHLKGFAQAFAELVFLKQALDASEQGWAGQLRVPEFYRSPAPRLRKPTRFVALLATRKFLDDIYAGAEPFESIARFELGRAVEVAAETREAEPVELATFAGMAPEVVTGVIDDGIAFAHDRFWSGDGTTRIEFLWDQLVPSEIWGQWGYGREISKRHPTAGIDARMTQSRYVALVDEDEVYRESGFVDHAQRGHKPLAPRAAHGTHVMDLACYLPVPPAPCVRPIVAVQLPGATVADTSGATLGPQIYNGLCYVIAQAQAIASHAGTGQLPVVINVSYGKIAGPHDGSSLLETAMDELIDSCNALDEGLSSAAPPLRVVLPAGNNHLSRCHARLSLAPGTSRPLAWRVLPDDWTESHVEIWLPAGADALTFRIAAPDGTITNPFSGGDVQTIEVGGRVVGQVCHYPAGALGQRAMVCFSLAPTGWPAGGLALAPAGVWRITIDNSAGATEVRDIHAWIERDDMPPGHGRRGRQSYFDDADHRQYDDGGRAIDNDLDPRTSASYVKRRGTFNAIATGRQPIVIGGFRRDGPAAPYSASGSLVAAGRGPPNPHGPDAMLPSDDAASHRGLLGAGTRSNSCIAMDGTSVSAPQAASLIAGRMAGSASNDRQAVFDLAVSDEGGRPGKPAAERGGGGRIWLAPRRPPR